MSDSTPPKFGLGAPVRRLEDTALVTGRGCYTDDVEPAGTLRALLVRSEMGHARVSVGNLAAARGLPGVHLIWTLDDLGRIGDLPCTALPRNRDGRSAVAPPRPPLVRAIARHVGDPIAFIVADDIEIARDAAGLVDVEYDALPAVVGCRDALADGAPLVWPDRGSNLAYDAATGDAPATEAAFATAPRVCRVEVVNNRVVANYLEPRGIIAEHDRATDRYTLTMGTQGGHGLRDLLAEAVLGINAEKIRVITPDVGGGFGPKAFVYSEYPLVMLAAKATGRPVKWIGERTEHFLADAQGRDNITTAEMALDGEGRFLAMRVDLVCNLGAYFSEYGPSVAIDGASMTPGPYDIPAAWTRIRGVFTNTVPTDAYRGAGRPEAAYVLERLVDVCGRETGLGPVDIRRRNFIAPDKLPYRTATRRVYDSGDFAAHLEKALALADHAGFPARQGAARRAGKLRGLGIGSYIEACAFAGEEPATLQLNPDGSVTLLIGTQTNGQGHATAYAQFIVGHLGLDYDKVTMVQGDTDAVAVGSGTAGSRSVPLGAVSVDRAAAALGRRIKATAALALEADPSELDLADGLVRVSGGNRSMTLGDVAAAAGAGRLSATATYRQRVPTFPNGTHVCELEIDPDTGATQILRYTVVDDFGVTVNPMLLAGQVHGGVAQGIGQALLERTVYDADGQLLSASFLDYALPRAEDVPFIDFDTNNVPCTTNALGIKGAGEAGAVGACGAVMNAVADALAQAGVEAVDMPATPARLWAALHQGA